MHCILVIALLAVTVCPLRAEELSLLGGVMRNTATNESSYSWQLEYRKELNRHFSASVSYLNEGHVPDHHRDGHAATIWARSDLLNHHISLAAGAGPYFYFDTTAAKAGGSYSNNHGWGTMFSLSASWHTDNHLLFQVRTNAIKAFNSIDTFSALAGIGYEFATHQTAEVHEEAEPRHKRARDNELTILAGQTIVNSFSSDKSVATCIEYRRRLLHRLDGTIAWIYEGDNRLLRRQGLSLQLWGVEEFLDERLALGIGAGAYISVDHYNGRKKSNPQIKAVSGIVTLTASYLIHPDWDLRTSWYRIVTDYDRDTDILLGGIGYRF